MGPVVAVHGPVVAVHESSVHYLFCKFLIENELLSSNGKQRVCVRLHLTARSPNGPLKNVANAGDVSPILILSNR
jgi:hypothetical protein